MVVHLHLVGGGRLRTGAFLDHFILQTALGGGHALLLAVFGEEFDALFLGLRGLGHLRGLFFLGLGLHHAFKGLHGSHELLLGEFGLFAVHGRFHTGGEVFDVDGDVLALELGAHVAADEVAHFVHGSGGFGGGGLGGFHFGGGGWFDFGFGLLGDDGADGRESSAEQGGAGFHGAGSLRSSHKAVNQSLGRPGKRRLTPRGA